MEKKCWVCFPLPLKELQEWFFSSSGNNQWWAIPGRKQKHFDWQVVLEGTEGAHRNDDEVIDAEYISWIFFLTCSRLPVTAKALWGCILHHLAPWDHQVELDVSGQAGAAFHTYAPDPNWMADAELLLLCHITMRPGHLTPPLPGLIMVGWS